MKKHPARRYTVIALALVVAFSVISPAVGGPSPLSLAKKAVKKSKKAGKKAKSAKKQARAASEAAASANALAMTNAGAIDDLKASSPALKCPSGMVKTEDVCYESSDHPATDVDTAAYTCANAGLRLPSVSEGLLMVKHLQPQDENSGGPAYFTDGYQGDNPRKVRIANGNISVGSTNQLTEYRCVTSPSL